MESETNWVVAAVRLARDRVEPPTRNGLAAALGVNRQTMVFWERRGSMRGARAESAHRLAQLSGIPIDKLVS